MRPSLDRVAKLDQGRSHVLSHIPPPPVASSPFEVVRRSCLQQDGLPFADALTAEQMARACEAEGVSFGDDPEAVYTPPSTPWAMLSQALFTSAQRSCRGGGGGARGRLLRPAAVPLPQAATG